MSDYHPDDWVIVRITAGEQSVDKVLASWSGSYLYGASWKLNSGITKITEDDKFYHIEGYSGSTYHCRKGGERLSGYASSVFESFTKDLEGKGTIEIIPIADVLKEYP